MKKPVILLAALTAVGIATCLIVGRGVTKKEKELNKEEETAYYNEREEGESEEEAEEETAGADKQMNQWFLSRAYPEPNNLGAKYDKAWQQYLQIKKETQPDISRGSSFSNWASLGPSVDGLGRIGGRVKCLAIDPNNSNNLWVGSASGGIWKSTDAGANWSLVPTGLNVLGVSSILVDPANSNTIYAGTGEVYRVDTSNIGYNVWKTRGTYGIGIIKSTNGGATWSKVLNKNTSQLFAIQSMEFSPLSSDTIYACATDGLYRSANNGSTWTQILSKIYVKDICIHPTNTGTIVVSIGNMVNSDKGIYRTTNGATASPTWAKITTGLPASFQGSITLDNVGAGEMIASIGISSNTAASNREIYRSTNFGSTWAVVGGTTAATTTNHCSYQFWFAHSAAINPFATDSLLFAGVGWYRYRVSTTARTTISSTTVHADVHDIVFDPTIRGRIYVCCDGGVYRSTNGGANFSPINNGLNATQFYASLGVSSNVTTPNRMAGGLQDNGQVFYNGTQWNQVSWAGGDGTTCAIDPGNHNNILVSRDAKQVYRSTDGGATGGSVTNYWGFDADSRTGFVAPLAFSKSSPITVYLASDNLHKSTNSGGAFTNDPTGVNANTATNYIEARNKTAIALAVSATDPNKVYISTSNFAQADNDVNDIIVTGQPNILRTLTGGTPFISVKSNLPNRFVTDIAISPTNDDSVFVTLGGFGTAHVYVTGNGGGSWTALGGIGTSGRVNAILPDVPFNAIVFDPTNSNIIYAGCDFGVYVSSDRGNSWIDFNTGFIDAVQVFDLQISSNNKLIAATHGRGVFRSDLFVGSTLPVRLLDFNGANAGTRNKLNWKVAQEIDILRYELERSTDGSNFQRIATITARNSPNESTYSYDDIVSATNSEYFYRLKIAETDGSFTYSGVILLRVAGKNDFRIEGNPFRDFVSLRYAIGTDQPMQISYFNSAGALLRREKFNATAGSGFYTLYGLGQYPSGMYLLKVDCGSDHRTFKIVKN
ncbi:MAG: hypothetical protein NTW29_09290 [Bacteroidetes bacterium]|nr:hypothetical protein [Bacteroidota bacterium]